MHQAAAYSSTQGNMEIDKMEICCGFDMSFSIKWTFLAHRAVFKQINVLQVIRDKIGICQKSFTQWLKMEFDFVGNVL